MTIILQIIGFHNCDGCARKVRMALRRIGVELVEFEPESGNVTVSTSEHPEAIRYALERHLKKSVVILSSDVIPANQNLNSDVPHQVPANRSLDIQELGQVLLRLCEVVDGVEVTRSNTIRVKINHRENPQVVRQEHRGDLGVINIKHADVEYAPPRSQLRSSSWAATEPSAPLMPPEEELVYGYPPEFYGFPAPHNHDHPSGCCNII